jgi:topoisomerase IV subunit A
MSDVTAPSEIHDAPLAKALGDRYLAYALSTITQRALPDVRDGLKPVHRRILWAMRFLKLDPDQGFKKCARVVGDVLGKYHPHGEQSIYDTLVRLAQDFAARYPLVEGQGNFGNIDGDNAAAMRYTEARLTEVAQAILEGLDEDAVDFRPTYDGEDQEPIVMPGAFPNLLANGSAGIAVGMATSIPPHNAGELCDALLHLLKHPNARDDKIVELVPGPDFPTGGVLVEPRESILEAYSTGRGGFRVRAKWTKQEGNRGTYQIVVTEVPYQVQKSKLVERLAELIQTKKAPLLADVRDESAEDIRLVLEPRARTVEPEVLMETLFHMSDLEVRVPLNLNVLVPPGTDDDTIGQPAPRILSLKEALLEFLRHRQNVLKRRTKHRLAKIEDRLEILGGFLIAYLNLDEVIRIIRYEDEPKAELMKAFKLSDRQTEAILNMRLRSLRKLEEMEIKTEDKNLKAERKELKALLASDDLQKARLAEEVKSIKERFGQKTALGRRRTKITDAPMIDVDVEEAMTVKEPITVICSDKGWVRTMKGHVPPDAETKYKEGDRAKFWLHMETTDQIMVFATDGRFFTLSADKLPGGRGMGEPIRLMIDMTNEQDIVALFKHEPERELLVVSSTGHGFRVKEAECVATKRTGKQVLNVPEGAEAMVCVAVDGDMLGIIGENRKLLLFPLADVPEMARGKGVLLQRYKDGGVGDATTFVKKEGLAWTDSSGRRFVHEDIRDWIGSRGQAGRLPPKGFPKSGRFNPR